jgi:predicted nuclease with TOPRIM domain
MELKQQLKEMECIRAEINYLLSAPDLSETTREELRRRLDEVQKLRARWEVLQQQYQRAKTRGAA